MATLTITIGSLTSTVTASNAKAAAAFRNAALSWGYNGDINDNQAVADFVMGQLRNVVTERSTDYQRKQSVQAARIAARENADIRFDD